MNKNIIIAVIAALILISVIILSIFKSPQQKNLDFSSGVCKSSGDFKYLQGVRNVKWIDNSTMEILARVSVNCAESIKSGRYSVNDNKIILDYSIKKSFLAAKCVCNHDLIYKISNIEKRDYEIILKGYENFNIICSGLDDKHLELQSCCQTLAEDKGTQLNSCAGKWTVKEGVCSFECNQSDKEIIRLSKSFYNGFCLYDCSWEMILNLEDRSILFQYSNKTNQDLNKSRFLTNEEFESLGQYLQKNNILNLDSSYTSCPNAPTDVGSDKYEFFYHNLTKSIDRYRGCPLPNELLQIDEVLKKIEYSFFS